MSTGLDILFTRPLRTFGAEVTLCGYRTLSKTGRAGRPYAPVATVFLFSKIIELIVPRVSSFGIRLLMKGSEGSAYRISPKGEAVRSPKSIKRLESPSGDKTKNSDSYAGYSNLVANIRIQTPRGHIW